MRCAKTITLLLGHGAPLDAVGAPLGAVDNTGNTPLHLAAENESGFVAMQLLENGAAMDASGSFVMSIRIDFYYLRAF